MANAENLRTTIEKMIAELMPLRQLDVAAVHADGTVDLSYGDAGSDDDVLNVTCASSYASRQPGDNVIVVRFPGGNWEALARCESLDPTP